MSFFDDPKRVAEYISMAKGYDGRNLIAALKKHLPAGSTILELGMGPGKDLDMLVQRYTVTGSDSSSVFLDRYRKSHPAADLLRLDAVTIETDRQFDCIYSNKVLIHLSREECARSFTRQHQVLAEGGLCMHSFWLGEGEEEHNGLRFVYYTPEELMKTAGEGWEVVAEGRYAEMEEADSLYVLLRKANIPDITGG